jgi:hypothetical protein
MEIPRVLVTVHTLGFTSGKQIQSIATTSKNARKEPCGDRVGILRASPTVRKSGHLPIFGRDGLVPYPPRSAFRKWCFATVRGRCDPVHLMRVDLERRRRMPTLCPPR